MKETIAILGGDLAAAPLCLAGVGCRAIGTLGSAVEMVGYTIKTTGNKAADRCHLAADKVGSSIEGLIYGIGATPEEVAMIRQR